VILSLCFYRFCLQLISFQRFCSSAPANPMIPEDHHRRGYTSFRVGVALPLRLRNMRRNTKRKTAFEPELWVRIRAPSAPSGFVSGQDFSPAVKRQK
jgi:hypothetical protein